MLGTSHTPVWKTRAKYPLAKFYHKHLRPPSISWMLLSRHLFLMHKLARLLLVERHSYITVSQLRRCYMCQVC